MPSVGVLILELRIEHAHSLKDKRQVVKSLKDRLRQKFNVAVSEIEDQEVWQSAVVAAVTVSPHRPYAEQLLRLVEDEASNVLGPMLIRAGIEWLS